jgi:hypothetical protein
VKDKINKSSITHHHFALIVFSVLGLLLFSAAEIKAQASSPYSRFGLGSIRSNVFSANRAMGDLSAPYYSAVHINYANPASYASLLRTTIEAGALLDGASITTRDSTYSALNGGVSHLAIAFVPKPDKWAVTLGLVPVSNLSYTFIQNFNDTTLGSFREVFAGKGSTYNAYIGGAYKIKGFSIGTNLGYTFGKLDYQKTITFPDTVEAYITRNITNMNVRGFSYTLGVQYQNRIYHNTDQLDPRTDIYVTAGATVAGGIPLVSSTDNYWDRLNFNSSVGFTTVDTVLATFNTKGTIKMPMNFSGGIMFGNEKFWMIGTDFKYNTWSNFSSPLNNDQLSNSWKWSIGFQVIPRYDDRKFFNKMQYRAGFYYGASEFSFRGQKLNELAGTVGLGVPFKNVARLNISGQFGIRGVADKSAIRETFYRLSFGLVLNDIWFIKRKYD